MPTKKLTTKKQQTDDSSSDDEKMTSTKKNVTKGSCTLPVAKTEDKKLVTKKTTKKDKDSKDVTKEPSKVDNEPSKVDNDAESDHSPVEQTDGKGKEKQTENQAWGGDLSDDDVNGHVSADDDVAGETGSRSQHSTMTKGRGAKYSNSAINFDYSQYESVETGTNELNSKDLIKVLIVRAYNDGQHQLCRTLKQTLRAMNLECDFPGNRQPPRDSTYQETKPFRTNKPQGNFSGRRDNKDSDRGESHEGGYSGAREGCYSGAREGGYSGAREGGYSGGGGGGYQGRGTSTRFGAGNKRPTSYDKNSKDF